MGRTNQNHQGGAEQSGAKGRTPPPSEGAAAMGSRLANYEWTEGREDELPLFRRGCSSVDCATLASTMRLDAYWGAQEGGKCRNKEGV